MLKFIVLLMDGFSPNLPSRLILLTYMIVVLWFPTFPYNNLKVLPPVSMVSMQDWQIKSHQVL